MGLASALSTALTGLNAAETTIDVVGNNVANANTVGFKASTASFATQLLQTRSLGSAPGDVSGGTNPRQIGLGTKVAEITPNFTQGTVQVSNSPTDLAIQGEGFLIVGGTDTGQFYTRNGILKTNEKNELVTLTGQRLLGFGVDDNYQIQNTSLVPLTIPLGQAAVAQATKNVVLAGTMTPTGDLSDTAEVIGSTVLIDGTKEYPTATTTATGLGPATIPGAPVAGGVGTVPAGTHTYRITEYNPVTGNEGPPSTISASITNGAAGQIDLGMPAAMSSATFTTFRVYRSDGAAYGLVGTAGPGATYNDNTLAVGAALPDTLAQGAYSYYVTFKNSATGEETRPSALVGPVSIATDGRSITLDSIPTSTLASYDKVEIYRNLSTNTSEFHKITELNRGATTYVDGDLDATIVGNPQINLDGPHATPGVALKDIVIRDGNTYTKPFDLGTATSGTIELASTKGGRTLATKTLDVTATTTLQDLATFIESASGIQDGIPDPDNPTLTLSAGADLNASTGQMVVTSNRGTGNAVDIGVSAMTFTPLAGTKRAVDLGFTETTAAVGESAVTEFVAYDSLGIPLNVRVTAVLESRTDTETIFRWFADSGDNSPGGTGAASQAIAVGTGQIKFDGFGKVSSVSNSTVAVERVDIASADPLSFKLDFSQVSGLAASKSSLSATRQDGSSAGVLSSFIIGEDGAIRGVFSNGAQRDLGQIRLARFNNPAGLKQQGDNLYSTGVNSGEPIVDNPGEQGIGSISAGAQELSNTDVGQNLIDLITASTQYRGGARVITSVQQLLDELLNLRR